MAAVTDEATPPEGVTQAISELTTEEWLRLDVICRKYAYGDENLALKLFDETFKRVLDGRRVLPREEKFIAFLGGVIKSISRELRTSAGRDASSVTVLDVDLSEGKKVHEIAEDDSTLHGSLVERELIAKETLDELENTFADDESALTVLMGIADNMPRKEIEKEFDMTSTEYDSARTKIRRRMANRFSE